MRRGTMIAVLFACDFLCPASAFAGGLEFPGTGTEALGRGAAFTAKADDATAVEYNVAGLARQRGTNLLLDGNLVFSSFEFQRAGSYPDDPSNPLTPWGGKPFPKVENTGGPFFAPMAAITTDFGRLDRWTFAAAVYGPSSVGNRTYPLGVNGFPSPSRYDFVQSKSLIIYPTLAAAVRMAKWLDVGLELQVVYGKFDLTSVSYADLGPNLCPNAEYQPCDSTTHLLTDGTTATAAAGILVRPASWIALGLHVRGPYTIAAAGTVTSQAPRAAPVDIKPGAVNFTTSFPWVVRAGLRFVYVRNGFEKADLELDGTYEGWGSTGDPRVDIPDLGLFHDIHTTVAHHYKDTFSLRAGAAYNVPIHSGVLSVRAGGFYDSSATDDKDTRLDFDTLEKIGITAGLGFRIRGVKIDVGYAYLYEPERMVSEGQLTPTIPHDPTGPMPAVNDGRYHARTQIVSLGISFNWDEVLKKDRVPKYGADWERRSLPPPPPPAPPAPSEEPPAPEEPSQAEGAMELEAEQIRQPSKKRKRHRRGVRSRAARTRVAA